MYFYRYSGLTYATSRPSAGSEQKSVLALAFKNSVEPLAYLYICVHERVCTWGEYTAENL